MSKPLLLAFLAFCVILSIRADDANTDAPAQSADVDDAEVRAKLNPILSYIDSPLSDIEWCGANKSVIFILTDHNSLYRTKEDGTLGHRLTEELHKLGKQELQGDGSEVGKVVGMAASPVDPSLFLFLGDKGINWITEDCGATFRVLNNNLKKIDTFEFHPKERDWVLASTWTECSEFTDEPCRKYQKLYVSKNLGGTWEPIADYVYQFAWGMPDQFAFSIPKERIIIAYEPTNKGHQNSHGWSETKTVIYSDDFMQTNKVLVKGGNKFLMTDFFLFVVKVEDAREQDVILLAGSCRTPSYMDLRPIQLPNKLLKEHSYTILDTSEHAVFLHINHDGDKSKFGNIYVSDSTGSRYSMSLQNNVRDIDGQCDFERVQGLEGIYLANVYDKEIIKKLKKLEDKQDEVDYQKDQGTKAGKSSGKNKKGSLDHQIQLVKKELQDNMQTLISFDKGGVWKTLTPPFEDADGKRIFCDFDDCGLHLHSISSYQFGPFYTTESSMGIILGTGNVGRYLSHRSDEVNTYLSRDGGVTWFEIAKESHIYEIGDHGSIIVMAPDQRATKHVLYTWNEGKTWQKVKISEDPVEIDNIIIEPSNTAEKFIIYGKKSSKDEDKSNKGIVVYLDFFPLHSRYCVGSDTPDTAGSDYETWSPNGKVTQNCLLGKKTTYIRKKRESECFNEDKFEKFFINEQCVCSEEDWECDFGYFRRDNQGACVTETGVPESYTPPEVCDDFFYVTQGYRKVAGDMCKGGVDHAAIQFPCPGRSILSAKNIVILATIASIIYSLVWLSNSSNFDTVKGIFGGVFEKIKSQKDQLAKGFKPITSEIPDSLRDRDDDDDNRLQLEGDDNLQFDAEDPGETDATRGKRMTKRQGLEAANKRVPAVSRPGEKKDNALFI